MSLKTHLLSWIIFSPLFGMLPILLLPKEKEKLIRLATLIASLIPFGLSLCLFSHFQGTGEFEFQEIVPWLKGYNVYYQLGVDGFSVPLILLTTLLVPLVILQSWNDFRETFRGFYFFLFLLEVGIDRKSTRLNSSHSAKSRMPSSA